MNKVFLIGKIITEIEFKFIINSKDISIASFKIETLDKQIIQIRAYNEIADYVYSKFNKNDFIVIEGRLEEDCITISSSKRTSEKINAIL